MNFSSLNRTEPTLLRNEKGQGLTEYLILLILISVTCIGVVTTLGSRIETKLKKAHEKINSVSVG